MEVEKLLPEDEYVPKTMTPDEVVAPTPGTPSAKAQSWGVVISIVVIVLMIVIGAFYAWGERISENKIYETVPVTDDTNL